MKDTQWPRYEVFKQDNERKTHEAVGSVHAPDGEMALLNARDVFVRRPSAVSLWVAPESEILSLTAEELAENPQWLEEAAAEDTAVQTFYVFTKTSQRRSMTFVKYVGDVSARTAKEALQQALQDEQFDPQNVFTWWIVPQAAVTRSEDEAAENLIASWFEPATDKTYRQQSYYGFVGVRKKQRHARRAAPEKEE